MITVQNKKWTGGTEAWAFPGGVLNNSPDGHMVTCCHLPPHSASVSSPLTQFLSLRKKSLVFDLSPQETLQENESSEGGGGSESHSVMSDSLRPHGLYSPWNSPGQNIGVGSLSLLQGIFPTQGSHPGLPHCRWILYQLSYQGSPNVQKWGLNEIMGAKPTEAHGELSRNVSTYHYCLLHIVSYDWKWLHLRTSKIV